MFILQSVTRDNRSFVFRMFFNQRALDWDRNWLKSILDIDINLSRNSILFGKINNFRSNRLENLIILIIKYYIYITKFTTSKNLNFENLKTIVVNRLYIEKFILLKNCKYKEFDKCLKNVLQKIEHSSWVSPPSSYISLNVCLLSNLLFSSIKYTKLSHILCVSICMNWEYVLCIFMVFFKIWICVRML